MIRKTVIAAALLAAGFAGAPHQAQAMIEANALASNGAEANGRHLNAVNPQEARGPRLLGITLPEGVATRTAE